MKDITEEIISSCRLLNQTFIEFSVRIHIILYYLEYLFSKHHANLNGMTNSQQTICSENHPLLTMWSKIWMVSWYQQQLSPSILVQNGVSGNPLVGGPLSYPLLFPGPSRLLHRNTENLSAYASTTFKLFMKIKEQSWGLLTGIITIPLAVST